MFNWTSSKKTGKEGGGDGYHECYCEKNIVLACES